MNLIDRYVFEVGRRLPRKNRADIQAELRSLLSDSLEARVTGEPTEEDIVAVLEEFGAPKKVAASYYPRGQYLIGPVLYPIFRLVAMITVASVIGAQLLAVGVDVIFSDGAINLTGFLVSILSSIPSVFGGVVIVFAILQWLDVKADIDEEVWKPLDLPETTEFETVKRWERSIGIAGGVYILGLLNLFPDKIGVVIHPGGEFFDNPVILQYLGLINISIILSIALDIYLLWQGKWKNLTRITKVAMNIFSIVILSLLVQGHTAWLVEHNAPGFFSSLGSLADGGAGTQAFGMNMFRMAFGIALIVTIIEVITMGYRFIRARMIQEDQPLTVPLQK